jgi:hypothetical protein
MFPSQEQAVGSRTSDEGLAKVLRILCFSLSKENHIIGTLL